jgi:hypothetical protein
VPRIRHFAKSRDASNQNDTSEKNKSGDLEAIFLVGKWVEK